jgi:hypothetical protein
MNEILLEGFRHHAWATKLIILDQGAFEAEQSVLVVQALHHGNAHREQTRSPTTGPS